jgi:hypothetical protein
VVEEARFVDNALISGELAPTPAFSAAYNMAMAHIQQTVPQLRGVSDISYYYNAPNNVMTKFAYLTMLIMKRNATFSNKQPVLDAYLRRNQVETNTTLQFFSCCAVRGDVVVWQAAARESVMRQQEALRTYVGVNYYERDPEYQSALAFAPAAPPVLYLTESFVSPGL